MWLPRAGRHPGFCLALSLSLRISPPWEPASHVIGAPPPRHSFMEASAHGRLRPGNNNDLSHLGGGSSSLSQASRWQQTRLMRNPEQNQAPKPFPESDALALWLSAFLLLPWAEP